ncbi:MAG: hypothetical protein RR280_04385 [Bacteroidaceae bacterium]
MSYEPLVPINRLKPRVGLLIAEPAWDEPLTEAMLIAEAKATDFIGSTVRKKTGFKDTFDIALSNYLGRMGRDGHYTLVLKNRFISDGFKVTVKDPRGDADKTDQCIINQELGVIKLPVTGVIRFVEVEYDAGLETDIPYWIENLVLTLASEIFALPDADKRNGGRGSLESLPDIYAAHHKQVPFAIRAM